MRSPGLLLLAALACSAEPATFDGRVAQVLRDNCSQCHGERKQKAGLRLDSHAAVLLGSKDGPVVEPGNVGASELARRISLSPLDDDFMPSGEHPPLSPSEISLLKAWIAAGAPATTPFDSPAMEPAAAPPPAAPDYGPRLALARALAGELGVTLVPRSRIQTDGLILRTAGAPSRCDDQALARLAPVSDLIVEAELARTRVTDKGMEAVGAWKNLRRLDVTRTAVTSDGLAFLAPLQLLESLNLTQTRVDGRGLALARKFPALRRIWAFEGP